MAYNAESNIFRSSVLPRSKFAFLMMSAENIKNFQGLRNLGGSTDRQLFYLNIDHFACPTDQSPEC